VRGVAKIALILSLVSVMLWFMSTQPLLIHLPAATVPTVDPTRLQAHVQMLAEQLPPRDLNPDHLAMAARYIRTQMQQCGARPHMQTFQVGGLTYQNVLAHFGSSTSAMAKIVVGAHYDSAAGLPGADDNASGVAGLIELACLLAAASVARPVELVAYALEEPPHFASPDMGSYRHAQAARTADEQILLMISLEMIGYFSDQPGSQTFPLPGMRYFYPDTGDFIALIGRFNEAVEVRRLKQLMRQATSLPVYSLNAPPFFPGVSLSDHSSYWAHDYKAVMITNTAFYRNFAYHSAQDTPERLDYARMAQVVQGVYYALGHL
jgi:hypothetical protein